MSQCGQVSVRTVSVPSVILLCMSLAGCFSYAPVPAPAPPPEPTSFPEVVVEITDPVLVQGPAPAQAGGALPPQTSSKENVIIRTYFGTNRKATGSDLPYEAFSTEESGLSYGVADVSIPRDHRLGELEGPIGGVRLLESEKRHIMLMGIQTLDREVLLTLLRQRVAETPGKSALVFIHGYTISFEDAARRTAQLSYDLGFEGAPIFYSWPSQENELKYEEDGKVIDRSLPMITSFLEDIFKRTDAENVYLVAHSMGNRAMAAAMATLIKDSEVSPRVKRLIFTAPDIDAAEFEKNFAPSLAEAGAPVTLYASSKDLALMASKRFNEKLRRLGDTRGEVSVLKGIETIDATDVSTDFLGHSYFAENGSVVSDLFYLFRTDLRAGYRFNMSAVDAEKGRYWKFKPGLCKP